MNKAQNNNQMKPGKAIDFICALAALINIAAMFVPYSKDISNSTPVEILSLSEFQFGLTSANGKLLGKEYAVLGYIVLAVLALIAILLMVWAIRSLTHHAKAGKSGLISTILNTIVSVVLVIILSSAREFTVLLAAVIILLSLIGFVLSIIQSVSKKKAKAADLS